METKRIRLFYTFALLIIALSVVYSLPIYARTTIDRLFVTNDVPTDTVDGSTGKKWSVTESNYLLLGDTFYFGFDGIMVDSDCSVYAVITDPYGTEYKSVSKSVSYNFGGISSLIGLAKNDLELNFGNQEGTDALNIYGYHFTKIGTTKPSGIYTGTLHVGDTLKTYTWYMVDTPIEIRSNPKDISVQTKDSATFYVEASGSNLTYQWYYNDKNSSVGGTRIDGAQGPVYTLTDADISLDGKYFYCELSNYSNTDKYEIITKRTSAARLSVSQPEPLVSVVESKTAYDGKSHTVRVQVTGPEDYTIYYSTSSKLDQNNYMKGTTTCPSRTNVGTTSVYYYIHDNQGIYKDYSGSSYITILDNSIQQTSQKKEATARKPDLNLKGYLISAKSPKKGVLKLKWKKISKITGYQFFVSTDKTFNSHTLKKTYNKKLTSIVIKKWPSKKVYYVKMRPYKKKNGKKLYGYWSKVKKIVIK